MFSLPLNEEDYYEELRGYDYESEYLAVLRQEHFDPYAYVTYCEEHDESFDVRFEQCTRCVTPEREPSYEELEYEESPF